VCADASLPEWSPDGRYLSINLWTEKCRMGKLIVFDVSNWKQVIDVGLTAAAHRAFSPASKRIVCTGFGYEKPLMTMYAVTVSEGKLNVNATTRFLGDINFSWSPDSRWISFSRPTKLHPVGDTIESDLCLGDASTGRAWTLIPATDH